jgi:hypothetical protein
MNYERLDVITAFHVEHPDDLNPSASELDQFDRVLFQIYDAQIRKQAPAFGITLSQANRSRLALFAVSSSGAPAVQVGFACRYFSNVMPAALAAQPESAFALAAAAPRKAARRSKPGAARAKVTAAKRRAAAKGTAAKRRAAAKGTAAKRRAAAKGTAGKRTAGKRTSAKTTSRKSGAARKRRPGQA